MTKMSKEEQLKWLQEHRVDVKSIEEMDRTEELDLRNRYLGIEVDLQGRGLTDVPDFDLPALWELNLSDNFLTAVPDFTGLPKLKKLDISYNRLTSIPDFSGLPALQELDVSCNFLESIPDFNGMMSLRKLNISYNYYLNSIPDFSGLTKLVNLSK